MSIYKTIHLSKIESEYINTILNDCIRFIHKTKEEDEENLIYDIEEIFEILNP